MQYKFKIDLNKCVGCHACVLACTIENKNTLNWRNVNTFNELQHPLIPKFYLSLACNHCEEAPCMKNCPAKAYHRDPKTGAVIHDSKKCIGCKYCTWACPYDAPKYNKETKIVEKCTFCNNKILEGKKPACVNACPVNALTFEEYKDEVIHNSANGFPVANANPKIEIIEPRNGKQGLEISELPTSSYELSKFNDNLIKPPNKISARNDCSLISFSTLVSLMCGIFTLNIYNKDIVNEMIFMSIGILAGLLSLIHIGKKLRAYRAIINVKNSWLSREILFFSLFFTVGVFSFFFDNIFFDYFTIWVGFLLLLSIDFVYYVTKLPYLKIHSSSVLLTGVLITGLFLKNLWIIIPLIVVKTGLYIFRKYKAYRHNEFNLLNFFAAGRLDCLVSIPVIFWSINFDYFYWFVAICIIIGEVLDRIEFFNEIFVDTPQIKIYRNLRQYF